MENIKFYGDTTYSAMMQLLNQFNRERRHKGSTPFYITEAPQLRVPQKHKFYTRLIRKYIQSERKILHFCDTGFPGHLIGLLHEISENILDHPPIAVLGYASGALTTWKPQGRQTERKAKYEHFLTGNAV